MSTTTHYQAEQFDRYMRRAGELIDRAIKTRRVGYAETAYVTALYALRFAADRHDTAEVDHLIGQANSVIHGRIGREERAT